MTGFTQAHTLFTLMWDSLVCLTSGSAFYLIMTLPDPVDLSEEGELEPEEGELGEEPEQVISAL